LVERKGLEELVINSGVCSVTYPLVSCVWVTLGDLRCREISRTFYWFGRSEQPTLELVAEDDARKGADRSGWSPCSDGRPSP